MCSSINDVSARACLLVSGIGTDSLCSLLGFFLFVLIKIGTSIEAHSRHGL